MEGKTIKVDHVAGVDMAKPVLTTNSAGEIIPLGFTKVAKKTMDAVVHIKSTHTYANNGYSQNPNSFPDLFRDDFFRDFFQPRNYQPQQQNRPQVRVGQGSGVIISEDGYIVTNNHVIADADDIEVKLYDNRNYKATIIGTAPSTDLALFQIKEKIYRYSP